MVIQNELVCSIASFWSLSPITQWEKLKGGCHESVLLHLVTADGDLITRISPLSSERVSAQVSFLRFLRAKTLPVIEYISQQGYYQEYTSPEGQVRDFVLTFSNVN